MNAAIPCALTHWVISFMADLCDWVLHVAAPDKIKPVQGYVKAPLSGRNGVGALSVGMIVDHTFEI